MSQLRKKYAQVSENISIASATQSIRLGNVNKQPEWNRVNVLTKAFLKKIV